MYFYVLVALSLVYSLGSKLSGTAHRSTNDRGIEPDIGDMLKDFPNLAVWLPEAITWPPMRKQEQKDFIIREWNQMQSWVDRDEYIHLCCACMYECT